MLWNLPSIEKIVIAFALSLTLHVLIGLGQVITQGPLGFPGELALELSQPNVAAINVAGTWWIRAYGLTFHPNVLGGFLLAGMILSIPLLKVPVLRFIWWMLCIGLIISFSRSALLAAVIILPPTFIWLALKYIDLRRPIMITIAGIALIGFCSVVLLSGQIFSRMSILTLLSEYTSLSGRGELIAIAIQEIIRHPLSGIGAGNFPLAVLANETLDGPHAVHNLPLLFAAEIGIIGGLLWIWLWLSPGLSLNLKSCETSRWAIVTVAAWLSLGIIGLWDSYPWSLNTGRLLLMFLLALTTVSFQSLKQKFESST